MCVDYRDLNKASPKYDFPMPHIDMLVDNTAKFKVFSFMDGFSGYNQIKMAPEDMDVVSCFEMDVLGVDCAAFDCHVLMCGSLPPDFEF